MAKIINMNDNELWKDVSFEEKKRFAHWFSKEKRMFTDVLA